jgi:hypothetical protein
MSRWSLTRWFPRAQSSSPGEPPPLSRDPDLDEQLNRDSTPPADELIELQCMYVAEAYLPSHAPALYAGMDTLGWDRDEGGGSPLEWVRNTRERGDVGGWTSVGTVARSRRGPGVREADLPVGVDHAYVVLWAISPGLTVLTAQFVFDDEQAVVLDNLLRRTYETRVTLTEGGWRIHDPRGAKRAAVFEARRELRARCGNWLSETMPGAFASGALGGDWPAIDVITATSFEPFDDSRRTGRADYRDIARLLGGLEVYESPQLEDLRLALPRMVDDPEHVLILAGRKDKLFTRDRIGAYGGQVSRTGFASWLHDAANDLSAAWASLHLLRGYQAGLAAAGDAAAAKQEDPVATLHGLWNLRSRLLPQTWDAQALAAEMGLLCSRAWASPFRDLDWRRSHEHPVEKRPLGEQWRELSGYFAELLGRTEARVREALATDAQLSVAGMSLRLQHRVAVLTWVSIGIAAIAAIASALLALT